MAKQDIRSEIQSYVQVLETNYTDMIRDLKVDMERMKRKFTQDKSLKVTQTVEKNELEQLFVRCVEDMRKEIIKRRLKAEVQARKKLGSHALQTINQSNNSMRKSMSTTSD